MNNEYGYNAGTAAPHHQGQVYCETTGKTVAITFDDETGDKARIFAAAPGMHEALQAYIRAIDEGGISQADLFKAAENKARAILAKVQS